MLASTSTAARAWSAAARSARRPAGRCRSPSRTSTRCGTGRPATIADPGRPGARINLLNWDGKGRPDGCSRRARADRPPARTPRPSRRDGRRDPSGAVLQAASVCLQYPDAALLGLLPTVRRRSTTLPPGRARERLTSSSTPPTPPRPAARRSTTSRLFDTRRRCCLYLTWWSDGETRRRGAALAGLKAALPGRRAEFHGSELPDYLPAVLEFAATTDLTGGLALLQEHRAALELLRLALIEAGTPYAAARRGGLRARCRALAAPTSPPPKPGPHAARRASRSASTSPRSALRTRGSTAMTWYDVLLWGVLPVRRDRRPGERHDLALPLRPVRLDHPLLAALRVAAAAHRQPAVPLRRCSS